MSHESEQAVVAAAIASAEQYDTLSQVVRSEDITNEIARCVWDATAALREAGRSVDAVILGAMLNRSERWKAIRGGDGFVYVSALVEAASSFEAVMVYADIVKQRAVDRQLFMYSEKVRELAHATELNADQKLGEIHSLLSPLTESTPDGFVGYKEAVTGAVDNIIALMERGGGLSGLSTGFDAIDGITAGLQDADLIILAGRPSMGKTVLAMNIANHVAREHPVLVFSLEMGKEALATRSLSAFSKINLDDLRRGNIDGTNSGKLTAAGLTLKALKLRIDDTAGISVDQLRTRTRIAARKEKPRLIVIDYLTMLTGKGDNRTAEIGYISRSLKALAKEMSCPVVCLAQLNRSLENRPDRRPKLSDLRDSGEIEQDADVVMFNYLDERYDNDSPRKGVLELIIAKQRNGEVGSRYLQAELQYQRFSNNPVVVEPITKPQKNNKPLAAITGGNPHAAINDAEGF